MDFAIKDSKGGRLWHGKLDNLETACVPVHLATNTVNKMLYLSGREVMALPDVVDSTGSSSSSSSIVEVNLPKGMETLYACVLPNLNNVGREIVFRPPLKLNNYLAVPIRVEVRLRKKVEKIDQQPTTNATTTHANEEEEKNVETVDDDEGASSWERIGIINCGSSKTFSNFVDGDNIDVRFRFLNESTLSDDKQFPNWSEVACVPAKQLNTPWSSEIIVKGA